MIEHIVDCRTCGAFDKPLIELEQGEVVLTKNEAVALYRLLQNQWIDREINYSLISNILRKIKKS